MFRNVLRTGIRCELAGNALCTECSNGLRFVAAASKHVPPHPFLER